MIKTFPAWLSVTVEKSFAITAVSTHAILNFSEIARAARGEIIYFVNCEIWCCTSSEIKFVPLYAAGIFHSFKRNEFHWKKHLLLQVLFLVEMAIIETASEKGSPQLSTGVACLLRFPRRSAVRQAHRFGSSVVHDGLRSAHPCTFTANRRLVPGRSTPGKDGCYLSSL